MSVYATQHCYLFYYSNCSSFDDLFKICIFRISHLSKGLCHISLTPLIILAHYLISWHWSLPLQGIRFSARCAQQFTEVNPISLPQDYWQWFQNHDVGFLRLLLKSKNVGKVVRAKALTFQHFRKIFGHAGRNGGNKFPWGPIHCSLDFFDFSSNWKLKTGDEFGPEWGELRRKWKQRFNRKISRLSTSGQ